MNSSRDNFVPLIANTPGEARKHNRRIIIQALRRHGGLSRAELARMMGLTPQAIANIVNALIDDGMVREAGRRKSSRGQPPISIELCSDGGFALGMRIDSTSYNIVALSLTGEVLSRDHGKVDVQDARIFDLIANVHANAIQKHAGLRCFGIGIVTPGPFDTSWPGMPSPGSISVLQKSANIMQGLTGLSTDFYLGNDAYAAAIGEKLYGAAQDLNNFFYLYVGEGVGGGLVIAGESYRGTGGNSGEVGHMIVDPNGKPCYCGNRGCLGQYLSLSTLREKGRESWLSEAIPALRTAISSIENLFDPEAIILGGSANPELLKLLADNLTSLGPSVRQDHQRRLRLSKLGEESPAFGASALPFYEK